MGRAGLDRRANRDGARLGELDRIAQQVADQLREPRRIAAHALRDAHLEPAIQGQPLRFRHRRETDQPMPEHVGDLEIDHLDRHRARLDLRDIEDVADDREQAARGGFQHTEPIALRVVERRAVEKLEVAEHRVERRANLVTQRRKKRRFRRVRSIGGARRRLPLPDEVPLLGHVDEGRNQHRLALVACATHVHRQMQRRTIGLLDHDVVVRRTGLEPGRAGRVVAPHRLVPGPPLAAREPSAQRVERDAAHHEAPLRAGHQAKPDRRRFDHAPAQLLAVEHPPRTLLHGRQHAPMEQQQERPHHGDNHQRRGRDTQELRRDAGRERAPRQRIGDRPAGIGEPAREHDEAIPPARAVPFPCSERRAAGSQPLDQRRIRLDPRICDDQPASLGRDQEHAVEPPIAQPGQQELRRVLGDQHRERRIAVIGAGREADTRRLRDGMVERRPPIHLRALARAPRRRIGERHAQRVEQTTARVRRRRTGPACERHHRKQAAEQTVLISRQTPAALRRTRGADPRQFGRQAQEARRDTTVSHLPGYPEHPRRIRVQRRAQAAAPERVDARRGGGGALPPGQLGMRNVIEQCGLADLDVVDGLFPAQQEVVPLGFDMLVQDRHHAERARHQDEQRDDDAPAEQRHALITANRVIGALVHGGHDDAIGGDASTCRRS